MLVNISLISEVEKDAQWPESLTSPTARGRARPGHRGQSKQRLPLQQRRQCGKKSDRLPSPQMGHLFRKCHHVQRLVGGQRSSETWSLNPAWQLQHLRAREKLQFQNVCC